MSGHPVPPESIRALRAHGGRPTDLPDALLLGEVAGHDRLAARDLAPADVEAELAAVDPADPAAEARRTWLRWQVELLTDDDLADWFLASLPAELVTRLAAKAVETRGLRPALDDRTACFVSCVYWLVWRHGSSRGLRKIVHRPRRVRRRCPRRGRGRGPAPAPGG